MRGLLLIISIFTCFSLIGQNYTYQIGLVKYRGGGDWYANRETSLRNLVNFCNKNLHTKIDPQQAEVDVGSKEIFNYPFLHLTGHGNIVLNDQETKNLRKYLEGGGFLHIDDNYGMDKFIRREMRKVFPETDWVEVPFNHPIYHQKYKFPKGLPKIHEHDNKAPQGFALMHKGRMVCFYTVECDLGDGWEDIEVHGDSETTRTKALQMGANILQYVLLGIQ